MRLTASFAFVVLLAAGAQAQELDVILYAAFGTANEAIIEGRVITREERRDAAVDDGRSRNLGRNLRTLINDEHENVPVTVTIGTTSWHARTDPEGYFRLLIENLPVMPAGWNTVRAAAPGGTGTGALLVVPTQNVYGLISDFDDTVVVSEVNDKSRLLANSLLLNYLQREPVGGTADAYRRLGALNPQTNAEPLFYLSASPRQLQASIQSFLDHNDFPRGVLITKRVTNDASSEPIDNQFAYKIGKLVEVFERLPHVSFVLIGDDGEQDPEIYEAMRKRYGERVRAIWIRRVNPDPDRLRIEGQGDLAELLRQTGDDSGASDALSSDDAQPDPVHRERAESTDPRTEPGAR